MGRGRGKGKKLTVVTSHEDPGSGGEEVIPTYRRRGRPQKPLKDEIDEDDADKMVEEEVRDDAKHTATNKELKVPTAENGKKRRRYTQAKENSDSALEDNVELKSDLDDSTRSNGFRRNGNRRKNKPRRAAEAGVDCK